MPLTEKFCSIYKRAAGRSPESERIVATFGCEDAPDRNLQGGGFLRSRFRSHKDTRHLGMRLADGAAERADQTLEVRYGHLIGEFQGEGREHLLGAKLDRDQINYTSDLGMRANCRLERGDNLGVGALLPVTACFRAQARPQRQRAERRSQPTRRHPRAGSPSRSKPPSPPWRLRSRSVLQSPRGKP